MTNSFASHITSNMIDIVVDELNKADNKKKIREKIIDPILCEITERYYKYFLYFVITLLLIVVLLISLLIMYIMNKSSQDIMDVLP